MTFFNLSKVTSLAFAVEDSFYVEDVMLTFMKAQNISKIVQLYYNFL